MVKKFNETPSPSFCKNFEQKASQLGKGLTVIYSDQCPYIVDATNTVLEFAKGRGIKSQVMKLKNCSDVRELTPSSYGVFSIVYNERLLAYHYLLPKAIVKLLDDSLK